jgi:hypothetical protein
MEPNQNQNWMYNANMQHGLPQPYSPISEQNNFSVLVPPMSYDNVDYNASYGIPPRVPHIMNIPVPSVSGESSTMRHANVIEPPVGPEVIPDVAMSNEDSVQPSITTSTKRERELTGECWQIFEPIRGDMKLVRGKCLICKKNYTYKSSTGTGTLLKHKKKT